MADPTNDSTEESRKNLSEVRKLAEEIDASLASQVVSLINMANTTKAMAIEFTSYRHAVKEVSQIGTQIKHINSDILEISKNLGRKEVELVNIDRIKTSIQQQQNELKAIEDVINAKRKKEEQEIVKLAEKNNIEQDSINKKIQDIAQKELEIESLKGRKKKTAQEELDNLKKQLIERQEIQKNITEELQKSDDLKSEYESIIAYIKESAAALGLQNDELDKIIDKLEEANIEADRFNKKTAMIGKSLSFLGSIPLVGPLLNLKRLSVAFTKDFGAGTKELGSQLKNIFKSPVALLFIGIALASALVGMIKKLVKAVLELDEKLTSVANNMAMSVSSTRSMVSSFFNAGEAVNKLDGLLDSSFISLTNITKAISTLQEGFGTSAAFSAEMVQSQILLTDQMGLANEEAIGIQKFQFLAGVNAKNFLNSVTKQVSEQERFNKVSLSYRKVISEVAKASAEITASYKNNPDLLIKAVIQAQKLGMTLEQTRKIADSLLNFETSIEGELKAELVIGKQLNYEKARSLALDGKSAEAAAELVSQMGGLSGLTNLNTIQRRLLAESIGLSSEELVKSAQEQEILNALGESSMQNLTDRYTALKEQGKIAEANNLLAEIQKHQNGEILAQDIAKASLNQRLEQSINKIKEIFVDIADGPIIKIVEGIANMLKNTGTMKAVLIGAGVAAGALAAALVTAAIAVTVATAGANLAGAAIAVGSATLLGGAAGGILMGNLLSSGNSASENALNPVNVNNPTNVKDAAFSPKGGIIISTPEGNMFKTGENDYLYATPLSPSQMNPQNRTNTVSSQNTSIAVKENESIPLLKEMITILKQRQKVYYDTRYVGESFGTSTTSFA